MQRYIIVGALVGLIMVYSKIRSVRLDNSQSAEKRLHALLPALQIG